MNFVSRSRNRVLDHAAFEFGDDLVEVRTVHTGSNSPQPFCTEVSGVSGHGGFVWWDATERAASWTFGVVADAVAVGMDPYECLGKAGRGRTY